MAEVLIPDPFFLQRYVSAQEGIFKNVLAELKSGQKRSHWMWFIFPQVDGLGMSETTRYFAIKSSAEANAFVNHPTLGTRLRECTALVLGIAGRSAYEILGSPDDRKLQSCMTLFSFIAVDAVLFDQVLEKYYNGKRDPRTLEILGEWRHSLENPPNRNL